ncbi:hypothetical protein TNCV_693821 [Trichonephila clavipes]|nr:hypothetical protein TNCV_693821 [Trichonephila clavipes]
MYMTIQWIPAPGEVHGSEQSGILDSRKGSPRNFDTRSSDFDKPAASRKVECLAPLIVNKSSYETTPFFSSNDSSPDNSWDIFLRELAIMYYRNCIGDII